MDVGNSQTCPRSLTRHDLGREQFLSEVWAWNSNYGGRIVSQLRRLGASLDWENEFFTLDELRSAAVGKSASPFGQPMQPPVSSAMYRRPENAFVTLHERGLIHRRRRIVNWCPALNTAISDVEVEREEVNDASIWDVAYKLELSGRASVTGESTSSCLQFYCRCRCHRTRRRTRKFENLSI